MLAAAMRNTARRLKPPSPTAGSRCIRPVPICRSPKPGQNCSRSGVNSVSWDQRFYDPIILPGRKPLVTLRDAALYIAKLPKAEHDADGWQAAMQALLLVAEHDGPTMFARIGVMRALNRHIERVFDPSRNAANTIIVRPVMTFSFRRQ